MGPVTSRGTGRKMEVRDKMTERRQWPFEGSKEGPVSQRNRNERVTSKDWWKGEDDEPGFTLHSDDFLKLL